MGNRISKITTKTGDKGTSGLSNGDRLDKDDLRFEAMGDVDELNSAIGLVLCGCQTVSQDNQSTPNEITTTQEALKTQLIWIQQQLFNLGGEISLPDSSFIVESAVEQLDQWIEQSNALLPPLKEFVLPNGNIQSVHCHLARTICRRAERHLVKLHKRDGLNSNLLKFINRLSDLLFVYCRLVTKMDNHTEILWNKERKKQPRATKKTNPH